MTGLSKSQQSHWDAPASAQVLDAEINATLPSLVERASQALASAQTSAEVLEAKDAATLAYDAAKRAGRMARAKDAHDDLISKVYRAQADALLIEARAKARLADEYDAAQERGEVAGTDRTCVGTDNAPPTAADLGLRRDQIHEARQIRDAEKADPGLAERAVNAMVDARQEPTKAELRRSVLAAVEDAKRPERNDRRNPLYAPNPENDRARRFRGLCRSLAEYETDIELIASWDAIPGTSARVSDEVRRALGVLNRFMEAKDA